MKPAFINSPFAPKKIPEGSLPKALGDNLVNDLKDKKGLVHVLDPIPSVEENIASMYRDYRPDSRLEELAALWKRLTYGEAMVLDDLLQKIKSANKTYTFAQVLEAWASGSYNAQAPNSDD